MMSEFYHYKIQLTLKDGSIVTGTITDVNPQSIMLEIELQSGKQNDRRTIPKGHNSDLPNIKSTERIESKSIVDLKVVQLPPEFSKGGKNKGTKNKSNGNTEELTGDDHIIDDAILFAKPASSSNKEVNTSKDKNDKMSNPQKGQPKSSQGLPGKINEPAWGQPSELEVDLSKDFDFAANLAMFDKKSVFADFEKNDTFGNKLVDNNRLSNLAQKNNNKGGVYANDEMVLENKPNSTWELIGSNDPITRSVSDSNQAMQYHGQSTSHSRSSPFLSRSFKIIDYKTLNVIPACSPVQLLDIERIASDAYGVDVNIMAEVCASHLSQLIMENNLGGFKRLSNINNHNLPPLVLILVASSRCGARAFATGRHLSNRGVRVLSFVLNFDDSDENLIKQFNLFKNCGGKAVFSDFSELLRILDTLDTPVELIIDALQGYDDHLKDTFYLEEEQKKLQRIIAWCNNPFQSKIMMSFDIPSGIDGSSGTIADPLLKVNCKWCISMGLPITGIIHAYNNGFLDYNIDNRVGHYLVDIGIPNNVFHSKVNLRRFDKLWYTTESIRRMDLSAE